MDDKKSKEKNKTKKNRPLLTIVICTVVLALLGGILWAVSYCDVQKKIEEQSAKNDETIAMIDERVQDGVIDIQTELLKNQRELLDAVDDAKDSVDTASKRNTKYYFKTSWKINRNNVAINKIKEQLDKIESDIYNDYADLLKNIRVNNQGIKENAAVLAKIAVQ